MIRFSKAGNRPLNWNVLTIDSHAPERYRNQLAAMDRCAEEGAKVVALTMPVIVGMNMSFLTYCALNMMPDWGPILGLPLEERMAKLRDPEVRAFMAERAASPEAGVFPVSPAGISTSSARPTRRPTTGYAGAASPRSPRSGAHPRSTRCSTSSSRTTCAPCCGPARPTTTTSPGACAPRRGNTPP